MAEELLRARKMLVGHPICGIVTQAEEMSSNKHAQNRKHAHQNWQFPDTEIKRLLYSPTNHQVLKRTIFLSKSRKEIQ
jgi:hypothetical protein